MKVRCDLHLNGGMRKLLIVARAEEPGEHLAHKLAAALLFWDHDPIIDASKKTPALAEFEFLPDLLALDEGGDAKLWVECGSTTMHKLNKIIRRLPYARIVVMKETPREAERLRREITEQIEKHERIEILSWPEGSFKEWTANVGEKTEVYGEGGGLMLNLVLNGHPMVVEFSRV
jgi:hypothetical protein